MTYGIILCAALLVACGASNEPEVNEPSVALSQGDLQQLKQPRAVEEAMRDPRLRARALLAQSKYTEALRAFEEARLSTPVLVGLPIEILRQAHNHERASRVWYFAIFECDHDIHQS